VPNDVSAASFWIAAALLAEEGEITLQNVGLNESRMGFVNVLKNAGAKIDIKIEKEYPEPVGQMRVRSSRLKPFTVEAWQIASLIDEVPLLALIATQMSGVSQILGAEELRFKESDRLVTTQTALNNLGAQVEIQDNDLKIYGGKKLKGGFIKTQKDHRIAMMGCVARFCSENGIELEEVESATISDPYFVSQMESL
jgi:3-phosphoshikimate 1-carboxyvinyltransferase